MQHAALVDDRRVAAEQQRFERLGRRVHDGRLAVGEERREFGAQFFAQLVVEVDERFVEQHERRTLDERPRQRARCCCPPDSSPGRRCSKCSI